ncbi:MAG: hypothetical protein J5884_00800 [Paludibacteraceae bacterium]|nr:hypothetical protein [Paludibacteraceae bacterium]
MTKKIITLFLALVLCARVNADPVDINGLWYTLDVSNKTATLEPHEGLSWTDSLYIPNTVTYSSGSVYVECKVIGIASNAFKDCTGLKDVWVYWSTSELTGVTAAADAFSGVNVSTICLHVPKGTAASYKAISPWKDFSFCGDTAVIITPPMANNCTYDGNSHYLVNAGSVSGGTMKYSTDSANWSDAIPQRTDADTYYVFYKAVGDDYHEDTIPNPCKVEVIISKATPDVTAPTAVSETRTYSGSAQTLFNVGNTSDGTLYYKVTETNTKPAAGGAGWSTTIPQETDAKTYYLWYYVVGDKNHFSTEVNTEPVTKAIEKATPSVTAPTAVSETRIYNGSAQTLYVNGSTSGGTLYYKVTETNSQPSTSDAGWSTTIPQKTDAKTYYLWYYVEGNDNYRSTEVNNEPVTKVIDKAPATCTPPTAIEGLIYDGTAQVLIDAGLATGGTMWYKADEGTFSTDLPTAVTIGSHTVYYKVIGDANHTDIDEASLTVNIGVETITINAHPDPDKPADFYSTFYHGTRNYSLPADVEVEAYIATLTTGAMHLTKIADGLAVLPQNTAVILKATAESFVLTHSIDGEPVSFTEKNDLLGSDVTMAPPAHCYVLSGASEDGSVVGLGFYQYPYPLNPHKAYIVLPDGSAAPKRLRFIFDTPTGLEPRVESQESRTYKVIKDGRLIIIRGGVEYNAQGQIVTNIQHP